MTHPYIDPNHGHQGGVRPVNSYSNVVDARKLHPVHYNYLLKDLLASGSTPGSWRVLDAVEAKVGHDSAVEFTIVSPGHDLVWRRRVVLNAGRLVRIETC